MNLQDSSEDSKTTFIGTKEGLVSILVESSGSSGKETPKNPKDKEEKKKTF